jgi:ribosomal protein S18 acetylase RimI-like enzyme
MIKRKIESAFEIYRKYGLQCFWAALKKKVFSKYHFLLLSCNPSTIKQNEKVKKQEFIVEKFSIKYLDDVLRVWPNEFRDKLIHPRESIILRYNNDIPCYMLRHTSGEILGAMWIGNSDPYIEMTKKYHKFEKYYTIKNIFIQNNYRGRNLGVFLLQEALAMHTNGRDQLYLSLILKHRIGSVKIHEQVGFVKVGHLVVSNFLLRQQCTWKFL